MRLRLPTVLVCTAVSLSVTACASQPHFPPYMTSALVDRLPAVAIGFGHGFVAPLAVVMSLVGEVRIYSWPNGGWPYDFGFVLGFLSIAGIVSYLIRR